MFLMSIFKIRYVLLILIVLWAVGTFRPGRAEPDDSLRRAAEKAAAEISDRLPAEVKEGGILVPPFENDPDGAVAKIVRERLGGSGGALSPGAFDGPKAGEIAAKEGKAYVLTGRVEKKQDEKGNVRLRLEWEVRRAADGGLVASSQDVGPSFTARAALWLLITGALPWLFLPVVRAVLRAESNFRNFLMLAAFTAADMVAAALLGAEADSWLGALFLAGVFLLAVMYNGNVLNHLAGEEK